MLQIPALASSPGGEDTGEGGHGYCSNYSSATSSKPFLSHNIQFYHQSAYHSIAAILAGLILFFLTTPASATATNTVLNGWFAAQTNLKTWSAEFTQTRSLKTLTQPLTATGHIWFSVPNQFRWELGNPARTIALRQADDMYVIYPRLKRAEHYQMGPSAPKEWRDAMSLLDAGFPRDRAAFEKQFHVQSIIETNGNWELVLQPASAFARQMMPELRVNFATNNYSLTATELVFTDGSRMRNDFTNAALNQPVEEKIFQWTPPSDFKVTEPFAK